MLNSQEQSGPLSFTQLEDTALNVVENVCGIISRPVELILRPWHGTRYFPVPVIFFSTVMLVALCLFSSVTSSVFSMIPLVRIPPPIGIFGLYDFTKLYFLLTFIHSIRLYRRMFNMELEQNSMFAGSPLPFFYLIPKSGSFWFTRIALEPAFLLVAAMLLQHLFIIQSGLAGYFEFAAFALAMKNFIGWYRQWEFIRNLMDARFTSPILNKLSQNEASDEELASINIASFPKNLSEETRQAVVDHLARAIPGSTQPKTGMAH